MAPPDLLHHEPASRLDARSISQGVAFAFATGEGGELIQHALDGATLAPTTFDPSQYAADLFIDDLVRTCFPVTACGRVFTPNRTHLCRVLTTPPKDPACCAFRREILTELLAKPEYRLDLEKSYVELRRFAELLTSPTHGSAPELHQHRVDVLRALKVAIEGLSDRFNGAKSGLTRALELGRELAGRPAFKHLAELLAYEDGLARVDLEVGVGADGSVRGFEIVRVREARDNRFHTDPLRRLWTRLRLFLRGFRFGELEIMARLLDTVFTPFEADVVSLFQLMGDMEFYLGALGFHDRATSRGLAVCLPEIAAPASDEAHIKRELRGLFNPLLIGERGAPKPCDIVNERHDAIVLVTGPNSGGKTRLLQAVALVQLLGQSGVFVPARSAKIAWTEGLFVSLHHEVTAEQKEGRLGTELLRIRQLFEELRWGDVVIVDELCSGTNPSEAEAIIRLVLELLSELHPQVFVTTHFLGFAAELAAEPHVERLEFLQAALDERNRPTYKFVSGVAASALAAETAARLGVTLEELAAIVARRKAEHTPADDMPAPLSRSRSYDAPAK